MSLLIQEIEKRFKKTSIAPFTVGDDVEVKVKIDENRSQIFKGYVMGIKNKGVSTSVLVVKQSHGNRVEKTFPLHSPNFEFKLVRRGRVRKAKLYYNRERSGRASRIPEDVNNRSARAAESKRRDQSQAAS